MIVGFTLDDAALRLTNFDLDEAGLKGAVERAAPATAPTQVVAAYRKAYPDAPPYLVQARILTDARFGRGALLQAERKAAQGGAPVYLYLWTWPSPGMGGKFGAVHGIDVGLAFHNSRRRHHRRRHRGRQADGRPPGLGMGGVRAHRQPEQPAAPEVAGLRRRDQADHDLRRRHARGRGSEEGSARVLVGRRRLQTPGRAGPRRQARKRRRLSARTKAPRSPAPGRRPPGSASAPSPWASRSSPAAAWPRRRRPTPCRPRRWPRTRSCRRG